MIGLQTGEPLAVSGEQTMCEPRARVLCALLTTSHEEDKGFRFRAATLDDHIHPSAAVWQVLASDDVVGLQFQQVAVKLDPGCHKVVKLLRHEGSKPVGQRAPPHS